MSEHVTILERFARLPASAVDREQSVLRGVKLLGLESKNGRQYPRATIEGARALYEGAKVNVNHPAKPGDPRRYEDRIGVIRNPAMRDDGLYGDFHFNPKHPVAEQFIFDAEHAPEALGFSHNATVKFAPSKSGKKVVESIVAVSSVDLVADPATTSGLFEEERADDEPDLPLSGRGRAINDLPDDAFAYIEAGGTKDKSGKTSPRNKRLWPLDSADSVRAAINSIRKMTTLSSEDQAQALRRAMSAAKRFKIKLPTPAGAVEHKESAMSLAELTLEELKSSRPDLLEALRCEGDQAKALEAKDAELKAATDRLAALEAEQVKLKRQALVDAALAEAKLDKANEQHCSPLFLTELLEAKDEAAVKAKVADRAALIANRVGGLPSRPVSSGTGNQVVEQYDPKQWASSLLRA